MKTYTQEVNLNFEAISNVDYARFSVSKEDVKRWIELLAIGESNDLAYLEAWDYRCEFLEDMGCEGDPADFVDSEFRQEAPRVVVMVAQQAIKFSGYEKHGGPETEWSTECLKLEQLAEDFGLAFTKRVAA